MNEERKIFGSFKDREGVEISFNSDDNKVVFGGAVSMRIHTCGQQWGIYPITPLCFNEMRKVFRMIESLEEKKHADHVIIEIAPRVVAKKKERNAAR